MTSKFRARFDGKALIPEEPIDLPVSKSLTIHVLDDDRSHQTGPPLELLAMLRQLPRASEEDIRALEEAIEEGRRPIRKIP